MPKNKLPKDFWNYCSTCHRKLLDNEPVITTTYFNTCFNTRFGCRKKENGQLSVDERAEWDTYQTELADAKA